jgi:glycosyltransferase involved in cell wall biosynthesis
MDGESRVRPLRLLAIIEARTLTGPAKNLIEFAQLATAHGVETSAATFTRAEDSTLFLDTARRESVPVFPIPERGRFDRDVIHAITELVSVVQPDIIQTHAVKSHFLARLAGIHRHVPWVAFHHGYTRPDWRARLYNQLDLWSLRAPTKVITVSEPFRRQLQRRGVAAERIEIVHNAIRPDWAAEAGKPENSAKLRAEMNIAPDCHVVLSVGRLSREKDHATLLEAMSLLPKRFAAHLVIVGDGPERPRIERKIASLGLAGAVTLIGQKNSAEPYYGIANVVVLSSRSEGSPNALLEAMAAGVPVVATDVGGVPEIAVHGDTALLVQPGDPGELAESMGRLIREPQLGSRLAARARQIVRDRYAPEQRTKRLVEIYRKVAG